jgi:hypothetical protein
MKIIANYILPVTLFVAVIGIILAVNIIPKVVQSITHRLKTYGLVRSKRSFGSSIYSKETGLI